MSQRIFRLFLLVLVAVVIGVYVVLPNSPGIHVAGIEKDFVTALGLDLVGGVQALLEADLPAGTPIDSGSMDAAVGVVENRVNGLGLSEALVQKAGENRIVVELPGETDPERALATIQQTGLLEFVDMANISTQEAIDLVDQTIQTYPIGSQPPAQPITQTNGVTSTAVVPAFPAIMTGAELKDVFVQKNQAGNDYQISFALSPEGTRIFADHTQRNIGKVLAIVIDKRVISVPGIQSAIPSGEGVISGDFTNEEANNLAVQLRYGSLPIPLKVVEVRTVGPTLGQDSLRRSLMAGMIGFAIIILFMALFYRIPGLMADVAILIFAILIFAIFRAIPVTLTLPGIAGLMLSIGSALDANILIFERIKEELRAGKTLRQANDLGFKRAWSSIRDSNFATIITSGILFWFGSTYGATIVKGFSITLFLGVLVSVFCALAVTRLLMELVVNFMKSKDYAKWFDI